jgi:hypothetical protein
MSEKKLKFPQYFRSDSARFLLCTETKKSKNLFSGARLLFTKILAVGVSYYESNQEPILLRIFGMNELTFLNVKA